MTGKRQLATKTPRANVAKNLEQRYAVVSPTGGGDYPNTVVPVSARAILDKSIKESVFQKQVIEAAGWHKWAWVHHNGDSRRSTSGLPDLILCRPPRLIFAELKKQDGTLSKGKWVRRKKDWRYEIGQTEVLALLEKCGVEVFVWRPSDMEKILEVLR